MQSYVTILIFLLTIVGLGPGPKILEQAWGVFGAALLRKIRSSTDGQPVTVTQNNCENSETTIEIHNHYYE